MFLFLSKLVPLFIYPLGLICILLIMALFLLWRRPRSAAAIVLTVLMVVFLTSNGWLSSWLVSSLEWQNVPETLPTADAIVVLGGGVLSPHPPRVIPELAEGGDRIVYGAYLYQQKKAPWLILAGGRIDWRKGGPPESSDMAILAKMLGVPTTAMLEDPTSLNTYENAVNVKQILQQRGLKRVLLVTSATHMPRSLKVFQKQGIEAIPAPTDFLTVYRGANEPTLFQDIVLQLLPDSERLNHLTRALKEYLGILIYRLRGWL